MDERITRLARLLTHYCVQAKPEETIGVSAPVVAEPLAVATYEALIKAGAYPALQLVPDELERLFYRHGKAHHFDKVSPYQRAHTKVVDGVIRVMASSNTRALSSIDPKKQARVVQGVAQPASEDPEEEVDPDPLPHPGPRPGRGHEPARVRGLRVPRHLLPTGTNPIARLEGPGAAAGQADRQAQGRATRSASSAPDTDLTLSVDGPHLRQLRRHPQHAQRRDLHRPGRGLGRRAHPLRLPGLPRRPRDRRHPPGLPQGQGGRGVGGEERGVPATRCSTWTPARGASANWASAPTTASSGSSRTSCSTRRSAARSTSPSASPTPETGGTNQSALHWDMIKDLRKGGAIYVDGKVFQKDGKFV